jgi:ABC-type bacteriocin/lantibiotic exporter with double-glycine peptidase domain
MANLTLSITPVSQKDGYSCGFCAMKAVYRHYNLDTSRLRARLGTDNQPIPYGLPCRDEIEALLDMLGVEARGTLPFDMMAVLAQDGFKIKTYTDLGGFFPRFRKSLEAGHPALALIDDFSHWVVLSGIDDDRIIVTDSLENKPYGLKKKKLKNRACGIILIKDRDPERTSDAGAYAKASTFCLDMLKQRIPDPMDIMEDAWETVKSYIPF